MENLNVGTVEVISVYLNDRLDNVLTLVGKTVKYKVLNEDRTVALDWTDASNITDMRVDCLIDTSTWEAGHYELYVRPTIDAESPVIGPFDFDLI